MTDVDMGIPRPADGEAALAVTLNWLRLQDWTDELGRLALRPLDGSGLPDTLAECLAAAGLRGWRDAIVAAASPRQSQPLEPRLGWLMAQAALEAAVDTDMPGFFRVVEELRILGGVSDAMLASAVYSRVVHTLEDYPLVERLYTRLQVQWNSRFNEQLRMYAEATSTRPLTSRDLWSGPDGKLHDDGWAHRIAATLWPDRYMEMLVSLPVPFQHTLGEALSSLDLELVATLIRASPCVFSIDGKPLGPVVVFGLLNIVETQLATTAVQDMADAEIAFGPILDSVFSRGDGGWIARAWLQQIIYRDNPRRAGRAQANVDAQRTLRNTLLILLSGRIAPLGEAAFDWVRQEDPLWGVYRVLSEASILEAHGDAVAAAEILASAIRQGLVTATGRPAALVTGSPEATVVARAISRIPDLKLWFEDLWRDTYELREHLSYPAFRDLDNPAYPALAWSLIGLNSSQGVPIDTGGAWRTIGAAVFETQCLDPNARLFNGAMPPIIRVTVQLGAALVKLDALSVDEFASFMAYQLEPTAEHARLWQIVRAEASDNAALAVGRIVGAALLREALEAGLAQNPPGGDAVLNRSAQEDLAEFASRL